jgi:hypothetical protein
VFLSCQNVAVRTALKKQTAGNIVTCDGRFKFITILSKVVDKDGCPKKSAAKTKARQKSIIKARLRLLTQNFFTVKSI